MFHIHKEKNYLLNLIDTPVRGVPLGFTTGPSKARLNRAMSTSHGKYLAPLPRVKELSFS